MREVIALACMMECEDMIKLPDNCYEVDLDAESHDAKWNAAYELAYTVDIGVDDPDNDRMVCLVRNFNGSPVGAVWGPAVQNTYEFHIAVHPDYQGKGIGRYLLDVTLREYQRELYQNPQLKAEVFVINADLRDALYRRGFYVEHESFDTPGELGVQMTEAKSLSQFMWLAKDRDELKYKIAIRAGAEQAGVLAPQFEEAVLQWISGKPGTPPDKVVMSGGLEMINALPLMENDKHFLWSQHQLHARYPISYSNRDQMISKRMEDAPASPVPELSKRRMA